jgi:hypothetical protein
MLKFVLKYFEIFLLFNKRYENYKIIFLNIFITGFACVIGEKLRYGSKNTRLLLVLCRNNTSAKSKGFIMGNLSLQVVKLNLKVLLLKP